MRTLDYGTDECNIKSCLLLNAFPSCKQSRNIICIVQVRVMLLESLLFAENVQLNAKALKVICKGAHLLTRTAGMG